MHRNLKYDLLIINNICICGAGTMGSGIAQATAQAGLPTILYELSPTVLEKAQTAIGSNLQKLVDKGKLTPAQKETILGGIRFTGDIQTCIADICIEAIIEKTDVKIALFNQLAFINSNACILATNTSSLPVTAIAAALPNPERVIGLHFFNPAPLMKLVEIVKTKYTSDTTIQTIQKLAAQMSKTAVLCKDAPGFIVNRVARPYYIESLRLVEEGITDFEQADALLEASGFRMGPFKLMDLIGNDVNYAVSVSVYEQSGRPERLRPSPIQGQHVQEGKLGRKTGTGYYNYS
ncbi:MAG: 3-hydroxyacyl-CoA dehydrogenase NAD-binding domain-containing protein [Chitinophagaceae bacterium]